jgi:hypothetical protein
MDPLEALSGPVAKISAIVAALVAFNTSITTWSNGTVQRYAGFRSAVTAEETFWKERFDDYFEALALDPSSPNRRAKLSALSILADHQIPDFKEYRLGLFDDVEAKKTATERLRAMQKNLRDAIAEPAASDSVVAAERKVVNAFDVEQSAVGQKPDVTQQAAQARPEIKVSPAPTPSRDTQLLAAGDPNGWDVDVFWCAGREPEQGIYESARKVAERLADAAGPGASRPEGLEKLGRIRLRVLPELRQGAGKGYPDSGAVIRFEPGGPEAAAATALRTLIDPGARVFSLEPVRTRTEWYLSVFVCQEVSTVAGTPGSG